MTKRMRVTAGRPSGTAQCSPSATTKRSWDSATAMDRSGCTSRCAHQKTRRAARATPPWKSTSSAISYAILFPAGTRNCLRCLTRSTVASLDREPLQITLCKCPDTFCPLGPHIITADEVPDPNANPLEISTRVNGVYKQRTTTDTMIHSIPTLLEFLTQTVTLQPGDLMSSGTGGGRGMGREPQEFMHPGDTVTVGISGVGYLTNSLEAGWEQPR